MSLFEITKNCKYTIEIEARSHQDALELSSCISVEDWEQDWSPEIIKQVE